MIHKLKKLRAMSSDEVLHRLRERWYCEADRLRFKIGSGTETDRELEALAASHASFKEYLQRGPARRFYAATQNRDAVCALIDHRYQGWLDRAVAEAGRLCEHRLDLLGHTGVSLGQKIDWHCDPVFGYQWPRRYWADYDLVHSSAVDPKVIHELNRHQHLPRLAKAFFLTGEERYAAEALAQMESWIEQNPRWNGVNWQSSLEIAVRAMSWMWTIFLLMSSKSFDEQAARRILKSLFAQLDHVSRYPSVYSSPNTHLIGEAAALFIGGLLFSEFPRARQWRQFGAITLVNEMERQVSAEGVYKELSSYYHCYATDFYVHVLALAKLNRFTTTVLSVTAFLPVRCCSAAAISNNRPAAFLKSRCGFWAMMPGRFSPRFPRSRFYSRAVSMRTPVTPFSARAGDEKTTTSSSIVADWEWEAEDMVTQTRFPSRCSAAAASCSSIPARRFITVHPSGEAFSDRRRLTIRWSWTAPANPKRMTRSPGRGRAMRVYRNISRFLASSMSTANTTDIPACRNKSLTAGGSSMCVRTIGSCSMSFAEAGNTTSSFFTTLRPTRNSWCSARSPGVRLIAACASAKPDCTCSCMHQARFRRKRSAARRSRFKGGHHNATAHTVQARCFARPCTASHRLP